MGLDQVNNHPLSRKQPGMVPETQLQPMSPSQSYVSSFTAQQMQEYEARIKESTYSTDGPPAMQPSARCEESQGGTQPRSVETQPPSSPSTSQKHFAPKPETYIEGHHQMQISFIASTIIAANSECSDISFDAEKLDLPAKRQPRAVRLFRHTLLNVYRRLFSIVFIANAVALTIFLAKSTDILHVDIWNLATAASANIFVATAIRQDYVQNILYYMAWLTPQSAPLRVRRIVAKLYENGGVHSGCGIAGTLWFLALTIILSVQFAKDIFTSKAVLIVTCILQALLLLIVAFAYPTFRSKYHNIFEMSHRFAGWTVIILFWVELGVLADTVGHERHATAAYVLVRQSSFWFLILITIHAILPWLFLRRCRALHGNRHLPVPAAGVASLRHAPVSRSHAERRICDSLSRRGLDQVGSRTASALLLGQRHAQARRPGPLAHLQTRRHRHDGVWDRALSVHHRVADASHGVSHTVDWAAAGADVRF
jgi:hypothetical protein